MKYVSLSRHLDEKKDKILFLMKQLQENAKMIGTKKYMTGMQIVEVSTG